MDLALPNDFKEFLKLLRAERVEYLLVGGWAVIYHGYPSADKRFRYLDWCTTDNSDRIVPVICRFGLDVPLPREISLQENKIVRIGNEPNLIEIMTSASGVEFNECYRERLETKLDNEPVALISLPNLIAKKRAAGRLKDLADLEELPVQA